MDNKEKLETLMKHTYFGTAEEYKLCNDIEESLKKDLEELDKLKKLMGTPIQILVKCLEQAEDCKTALKHINSVIADFYNGEIDSDACLCAINETLKDADWRDKDEDNKTNKF